MLEVRRRKQVKALLRQYRPSVVARLTGVSISSVKRIAKEPDILLHDDAAERKRRRIGRPSRVRGYRQAIAEMLDRSPEIRSVEVLAQIRQLGYGGGKTALYALVASLRAERVRECESAEAAAQTVSTALSARG